MTDPILNAGILPSHKAGSAKTADSRQLTSAKEAVVEFEAIFLSQMLATMTQELGGAGGVAGGDEVYRDMFNKEVAKMISRSGGVGVADAILQEMLKNQEIK
jgi:Rod binding domain-containing protein